MRVLLISPIYLSTQGQASWVRALKSLGHEISVFKSDQAEIFPNRLGSMMSSLLKMRAPIVFSKYMNAKNRLYNFVPTNYIKNVKLVRTVAEFHPQLVLLTGGTTEIFPSTISSIKQKFDSKVYLMAGVNPDYAATQTEKLMIKQGLIDLVVENDRTYARKWERLGVKSKVLPISSVDPALHKKIKLKSGAKKKLKCDVCFVGTLNPDRQKLLSSLTEFDLKIWGDVLPGQKLKRGLESYYFGKAHGEQMVTIFNAAKIVLNLQPKDMDPGGNMRTFEIPGCGAFQLASSVDQSWFVPDQEVVLFENVSDLKKKIKYYLQNETKRLKIAGAGFARVHRVHTYQKHFQKLFNLVNDKS